MPCALQGRESLPSYTARRASSGVCGEDVLVPVALDMASEDGSGVLASTPSGSLYLDPSSPSGTARQHCEPPALPSLCYGCHPKALFRKRLP